MYYQGTSDIILQHQAVTVDQLSEVSKTEYGLYPTRRAAVSEVLRQYGGAIYISLAREHVETGAYPLQRSKYRTSRDKRHDTVSGVLDKPIQVLTYPIASYN